MEPDHIDGYVASLEQFARLLPIRFWEHVANRPRSSGEGVAGPLRTVPRALTWVPPMSNMKIISMLRHESKRIRADTRLTLRPCWRWSRKNSRRRRHRSHDCE